MKLSRRILTLALGVGLVSVAAPLRADPIVLNQWYTFGFGAAGTFGLDASCCTLGARSLDAGSPAWTINSAVPFTFFLTDGFQQGDSFTLFDNAVNVGATPGVAADPAHSCSNDEVACYNDPLMSHRAYAIAAGAHAFEIRVDVSPFGGGAAFFCLSDGRACEVQPDVVPEPSTYGLLAMGLVGIAGFVRRRRAP
jgi:hypothetical protein